MPGRHDAHDLALDQPLRGRRVAHLLADRHLVALGDEAGEVGIEGVVGDAGEGHAQVLAHRLGGERYLQLAGAELGVLVERLVEVAEAEEDDGVRVASLDVEILASDRGQGRASREESGLFYTNGSGCRSEGALAAT